MSKELITDKELEMFLSKERKKQIAYLTQHYSISREDAEDVYQESSIALFSNIKGGKLVSLTSTLSTYFTQICKNQVLKMFRDVKTMASVDDEQYDSDMIDELLGLSQDGISQSQAEMMRKIVSDLPSPCEEILWAFYADEKSMVEIAQMLNYKNARTVIAKKSQCISKLKDRFDKETTEEFYDKD